MLSSNQMEMKSTLEQVNLYWTTGPPINMTEHDFSLHMYE